MTTTALRVCECPQPEPHVKPGREKFCVKCDHLLDPRWVCSYENTREFLRRLEEANPGAPESFKRFEAMVLRRQQAGEPIFRQSFLARDNLSEAAEEASDLAMYACLHLLVERRAGGVEEMDLALSIANHAAKAYELLEVWKAKEVGRP